jgi:hypothetical protein
MYLNSDFDLLQASKRLVKFGFVNEAGKQNEKIQKFLKEKDKNKKIELEGLITDDEFIKFADMELAEVTSRVKPNFLEAPTGYPKPFKRQILAIEDPNKSILENFYFWILTHIYDAGGMNQIIKVTDSFAGSSQSSFFGAGAQRLSLIQDKISNSLQTIGVLVKDMFPQIHELHIWDERMGWYKRFKETHDKAADVTLKGTWIDMVEGGSENAGSVYGLSQKVGFSVLPDLFFSTLVKSADEIDKVVDTDWKDINPSVRNVLKRKLFQYTRWREESHREVETRRRFIIRYLRQHFNTIKMYMAWLKPYLAQMKVSKQNVSFNMRPEMVNAFENSIMEIELLATNVTDKKEKYKPVALFNFYFTTKTDLDMSDKTYQHRGPSHSGQVFLTMRGYVWSQEQIDNYRTMRDDEDLEFLKELDGGFATALDELGDELSEYMDELDVTLVDENKIKEKARADAKAKEDEKNKTSESSLKSIYEPFGGIFEGLGEMFGPLVPGFLKFGKIKSRSDTIADYKAGLKVNAKKSKAKKDASLTIKLVMRNYRKAHQMITW